MMKKFKSFGLLALSLLLCLSLYSCERLNGSENSSSSDESDYAGVFLSLDIETSIELRQIADFKAYYTDLNGDSMDISLDMSYAEKYTLHATQPIENVTFPLELKLVVEYSLKPDVADGEYQCAYNIKHSAGMINENDSIVEPRQICVLQREFVPLSPITENFKNKSLSSTLRVVKTADNEFSVEK